MRATFICAASIATAVLCAPAAAQDEGYFQQRVDYTMRVSLDTEARMLAGAETIHYTNHSPDTLREFYLHLYPNAYRSRHSAFMRYQRRVYNLNLRDIPSDHRGWLDLDDVRVDGVPVPVHVDDTIARFALPAPLPPGGSVTVSLDFRSKVRKHRGRAGYRGEHYDFAQWYPKVVVYDEKGFHPDPFMAGEFYGEFGNFDVHVELPAHYVVAATGVVADGDAGWGYNPVGARERRVAPEPAARKTVHFHAEDVHDFAWCADPSFVVQDTTVAGVVVRSFYRVRNAKAWQDTTLAHGARAVDWLTREFGPYPYPQVSIVDGLLRGGMEYPMLVMNGRASEGLVVHEVGHIYFYGILANDERAAAWLDEGFTTFQTQWYKETRYGPWGNRRELDWYTRMTPQPRLWEGFRGIVFDLQRRGYGERVAQRAEAFDHSYSDHVYRKAALILNAVRYALGEETFEATMQEYYRRWQLKHVNEDRFREVIEDRTGADLRLQFDQWLHTRKICDYRLAKVDVRESGDGYRAAVEIRRDGELFLPVEVVFELEDGSVQRHRLDGKPRIIKSAFVLPSKPKRTAVNPDNEIMDVDLADNFS
ncbi:MAG: M1 family metallopeptidase, partial [Candidatus Krumholzibacteria bacterium]|nr:M1 family metallopeptidase [Candidatus Krumholzibacteria bacterium]